MPGRMEERTMKVPLTFEELQAMPQDALVILGREVADELDRRIGMLPVKERGNEAVLTRDSPAQG